ncbi:STAS domain-containing protein [Streptomyces sp. ADMS]|uniref:STAS domain-containing protein n=1 Tax=Streptomyces sp. ADMS TaxID=3071415 RepID=UPI00296E43AC|nr:STAS domain-containing protein [Streptomyces sp. ADMS]MDW4910730.1 STAS domain-containing protein [Streptomyces sp. ADMS]
MADNHTRSTPYRTHRTSGDTTVVALQGEIDLLTVPALMEHLDSLTADQFPDLVLDLRAVAFIDCAGLGVLCRALNRSRARQGRLRLVTDSARLLRILRCTGLTGAFEIHPRWPEDLAGTTAAQPVPASAG